MEKGEIVFYASNRIIQTIRNILVCEIAALP